MIQFTAEHGYAIWLILTMLIIITVLHQTSQHVTGLEEDAILASVSERSESFLMNRTESKWGTDK